MTGPYEFREMMRDHEDTKREYRELAAKYEALRAQLAESEAACAGYREHLQRIRDAKWDEIEGQPMIVLGRTPSGLGTSLIAPAELCRQALQSNPGKAVGDVIAAAKRIPCKTLAAFLDYEQDAGRWRGENGSREAQNDIRALDAALAKLEGTE